MRITVPAPSLLEISIRKFGSVEYSQALVTLADSNPIDVDWDMRSFGYPHSVVLDLQDQAAFDG